MTINKYLAATITTALVASLATPSYSHADTKEFSDLKEGDAFYKEVQTLVKQGIINGYDDGTYRPNQKIIRGQAAKLFARALKIDTPDNIGSILEHYPDIPAGSEFADAVVKINSEGILTGDEGTFRPSAELTRDVMALWLVRAFDLEPVPDVNVPLTDLDKIEAEYIDAVKILYQNGITTGRNDGSYDPKATVTRGQFAAFMYRCLYQVVSIEAIPSDVIDIEEEVDLEKTVRVALRSGDIVEVDLVWQTDDIDFSEPGKYELEGYLQGLPTVKVSKTVIVEDKPLSVKKIDTPNLSQIELELNHSRYTLSELIDKDTYNIIDSNNKSYDIESIIVEGTRVTLTLATPIENGTVVTLTFNETPLRDIKPIKVLAEDDTAPTITSIKPLNWSRVKITFNEPLQLNTKNEAEVLDRNILAAFKMNNGANPIKSITVKDYGKVVDIQLDRQMKAGENTITFTDSLQDGAGLSLEELEKTFDVVEDKQFPKLIEVKDVKPYEMTLVFDEEITLPAYRPELRFHHTSRSLDATSVFQKNDFEVIVYFDKALVLDEKAAIFLDTGAVIDTWGNESWYTRRMGIVKEDTAVPELEQVTMLKKQETESDFVQVRVEYNEILDSKSATNIENYQVSNSDGDSIDIRDVILTKTNEAKTTVLLTLNAKYGEFLKDTYHVEVNDITDLYGNTLESAAISFTDGSETAPSGFEAFILSDNDKVSFVIDFGREMAEDGPLSIDELSNYAIKINGDEWQLADLHLDPSVDVVIKTYDNGRTAEIIMQKQATGSKWDTLLKAVTDAVAKNDFSNVELFVSKIEDKRGNHTEQWRNEIEITGKDTLEPKHIYATDLQLIEINVDDELIHFNPDDFIIFADKNGDKKADAGERLDFTAELTVDNDTSTIGFELEEELDGRARLDGASIIITSSSSVDTESRFGQKLLLDRIVVRDGIAPKLIKNNAVTASGTPNGSTAYIKLEFTEDLDASTVTRLSFTIDEDGYYIEDAEVDDNIVTLTVDLGDKSLAELKEAGITQIAPISDVNNNITTDLEGEIN
ncbi:hypothetical protein EJF36_18210 [Bacillus sp. HMF5848]|uniref:S-layer homology domain-containing protein n=1 Tax=Bacillus sp. HMF5848 TaxID=2495421 RepID=UPI000F76A85D|nr:S-layer homology domain-containing protein [Bacillus sp. HMF5848]RSK28643.1 hypothetical protein EJF36_18210 [Bacillus sp. HMF5848]